MNMINELLNNLNKIHTTELGVMRIKRNLSLNKDDIIEWCKNKINLPTAKIVKKGKNWYVDVEDCIITINSYSYTIITAHKKN